MKKKRVFHIQTVQKLYKEDKTAQQAMCHDLFVGVENENLKVYVMFNDEAKFNTCRHLNRHN